MDAADSSPIIDPVSDTPPVNSSAGLNSSMTDDAVAQTGEGAPDATPDPETPLASQDETTEMKVPDDEQETEEPDESPNDNPTTKENANEKLDQENEEARKKRLLSRRLLPEYRKVNLDGFKNRYGEDDGRHIIEALVAGTSLGKDISEEKRKRLAKGKGLLGGQKVANEPSSSWIHRVRIQSNVILDHLQNLTDNESWDTNDPRVFFRPFMTLIHYHPGMKKVLEALEERFGAAAQLEDEKRKEEAEKMKTEGSEKQSNEPTTPVPARREQEKPVRDGDSKEGSKNEEEASNTVDMDSVEALRHMRCYCAFMEKEILPIRAMFDGTAQKRIRFSDLWCLFRTGELIYSPPRTKSMYLTDTKDLRKSMYQTVFRLYFIGTNIIEDKTPNDFETKNRRLNLYGYYIDHNGHSYQAVEHLTVVNSFEGEIEISKLGVYPIRYAPDSDKIQAELREQGRRFHECIEAKHLAHRGWNLIHTPLGHPVKNLQFHEHIESDVIVDFKEGFHFFSEHKSNPVVLNEWACRWESGEDTLDIRHWSDSKRTKCWLTITERTQRNEGACDQDYNDNLKVDKFLQSYKEGKADVVGEDDLVLLPSRLLAYVLRGRRFAMVDIKSLSPVKVERDAFDNLKINPRHKKMVRALVHKHFQRQKVIQQGETLGIGQDIIRGKGLGLVILLHGVPGVGKTATAEAVAQTNKKPLFVITCGDLGISPKDVETSLNEIFRLAHLWNCVLLLDEADIFLSKRQTPDLKRNALVSVFLRVLEYYSGVLFLTTNRVGTLDEAFKSRIYISLYYPPLQRQQTIDIFDMNIKKLKEMEVEKQEANERLGVKEPLLRVDRMAILRWAEWYYDAYPKVPRWNGRQIRNAFQIASSLAYYDMAASAIEFSEDEGGKGARQAPVLDDEQFHLVAEAISRFDGYMQEATKGTDMDGARIDGIRADDYSTKNSPFPERPLSYSAQSKGRPSSQRAGPEVTRQGVYQVPSRNNRNQPMSARGGYGQLSRGGPATSLGRGYGAMRESGINPRAPNRRYSNQGLASPPPGAYPRRREQYDSMEGEGYDDFVHGDVYEESIHEGFEGETEIGEYQPDPEEEWGL